MGNPLWEINSRIINYFIQIIENFNFPSPWHSTWFNYPNILLTINIKLKILLFNFRQQVINCLSKSRYQYLLYCLLFYFSNCFFCILIIHAINIWTFCIVLLHFFLISFYYYALLWNLIITYYFPLFIWD